MPEGHATDAGDTDSDPGCVIGFTVVISAGQPYVAVAVNVRRVRHSVVCSPGFRFGIQHLGPHQFGDLRGGAGRCPPRRDRLFRLDGRAGRISDL